MALLSAHGLERLPVLGTKGKRVGVVTHVLFHPTEPRAVGVEVERPRLAWVIARKPTYLALDATRVDNDGINITEPKAASGRAAEKRLGLSWDETVIWRGMPVWTVHGDDMGSAGDVIFGSSGPVSRVELTGGVAADAALGRRTVDGAQIEGFDGVAIRVDDSVASAEYSGGAAAMAGRGTAIATDAAGKAAVAAGRAAGKAAAYGRSAANVAAQSETGKKAADWLKRAKDATLDAMRAPDDEE